MLRGCRCCPPRPGGLAGTAVSRPRAHDMRPYKEGLLRRSAARLPLLPASSRRSRRGGYEPPAGRMICAPTKRECCAAVLRGCRCCPPHPGGLAGAAMSRPRAHDMRPYERGPCCAAVQHGCRCCQPHPGGLVGAAMSRPPAHNMRPCERGPAAPQCCAAAAARPVPAVSQGRL